MQVLFLNPEGCLSNDQSDILFKRFKHKEDIQKHPLCTYIKERLCPISISNLEYILEMNSKLKIVITGEGRFDKELRLVKSPFKSFPMIFDRIYDTTPLRKSFTLLEEADYWVRNSTTKVSRYALLDQRQFHIGSTHREDENCFEVNPEVGLLLPLAKKIADYFLFEPEQKRRRR